MKVKTFVVFHKIFSEVVFSGFEDEESRDWFIRYGVNASQPKKIIRKHGVETILDPASTQNDTLLEYALPNYDPKLQERGFMETSCYVHVLKNELYKGYDYIGVCQYDMRWTPLAVTALRELALDNHRNPRLIYGMSVGVLCNREGALHPLTFADRVNWSFLLKSYNSYFGTNHQPQIFIEKPLSLFQTYIMPTSEFIALASWLGVLCDELYPAHCMPPYETHWGSLSGKTERAAALFIAARMQEGGIVFRDLPLHHDEDLVRQLNIIKGHYKN